MRTRIALVLLALFLMAGNALAKDVVFAVDATYPPMEMIDADKNIVGFGPEVVIAMGKAGGFNPILKNTAWDGIFAGLASGKYDAIASSVSITDERKQNMDFSDPYFEVKQGVIVPKGSGIASVADLAGKTVASQMGTTGYFLCKKIEGATAKSYDEIGLAVEDLYNGRIDPRLRITGMRWGWPVEWASPKSNGKVAPTKAMVRPATKPTRKGRTMAMT